MAGTNFIQAIHHLKISKEYFQDIQRVVGEGTKGYKLAKRYLERIEWIYNDVLSNPDFDNEFREGLKQEWLSDSFVMPAIMEKIARLTPEQREGFENILDTLLKGETLTVCLQ